MANFGFVYCLANGSMPGVYKVGFTDRAPLNRAYELSMATGVPEPFSLFFFLQIENAYQFEQRMHKVLSDFRVSENREFFRINHELLFDTFHKENDGMGQIARADDYDDFVNLLIYKGSDFSLEYEKHKNILENGIQASSRFKEIIRSTAPGLSVSSENMNEV